MELTILIINQYQNTEANKTYKNIFGMRMRHHKWCWEREVLRAQSPLYQHPAMLYSYFQSGMVFLNEHQFDYKKMPMYSVSVAERRAKSNIRTHAAELPSLQ